MSKNLIWVGLGLGIAALAGVLWWQLRDDSAGIAAIGGPETGVPDTVSSGPPDGPVTPDGGRQDGDGPGREAPVLDPLAELPDLVPAEPLRAGLALVVLAPGGRQRAGGAEVVHLEAPRGLEARSWARLLRTTPDQRRLFQRYGTLYLADERGELFVPRPLSDAWIRARAGEDWNVATISPTSGARLEIELRADLPLELEVLDADGAPTANVPVVLRRTDDTVVDDFWEGRSAGPDGLVTVPGIAQLVGRELHRGGRFVATLGFPTGRSVEVELRLGDLPRGLVTLPMPPTGRLDVVLRDVADRPPAHDVEVVVSARRPELQGGRVPRYRQVMKGGEGRTTFPLVAVGVALDVRAASLGGGAPATRAIEGPSEPGQLLECRIKLDAGLPVLRARIVDVDGTAYADRPVTLTTRVVSTSTGAAPEIANQRVTTAADGSIRYVVTTAEPQGTRRELVVFAGHGPRTPGTPATTVDVSGSWDPGEFDLGDVRFEHAPLLCAGRVRDGSGQPVADARLRVERRIVFGEGRSVWADLQGFSARSDAGGRFEIRGVQDQPGDLRLLAEAGDRTAEPRAFEPGATDVDLVLRRSARLAGSLLLDGGIPAERLLLRLTRPDGGDGPATAGGVAPVHPDENGLFRWEAVPPGTWRFSVELPAGSSPVHVVEALVVEEGFDGTPPELDAIDLRGQLGSFVIRVVDGEGNPVPRAFLYLEPAGQSSELIHGLPVVDGLAEVVCRRGPVDVEVHAQGLRTARLTGVEEDREVVLRGGLPVKIIVDGEVPPVPSDFRILVFVEPYQDEEGGRPPLYVVHDDRGGRTSSLVPWGASEPVALDQEGEALLEVPEVGVYAVRWRLEQRGTFQRTVADVPEEIPVVIEVGDMVDVLQAFLVPLTEVEVAAGMKQFPLQR